MVKMSAQADWSNLPKEEQPQSERYGTLLQSCGKQKLRLQSTGEQHVELERQCGTCPQCDQSLFPWVRSWLWMGKVLPNHSTVREFAGRASFAKMVPLLIFKKQRDNIPIISTRSALSHRLRQPSVTGQPHRDSLARAELVFAVKYSPYHPLMHSVNQPYSRGSINAMRQFQINTARSRRCMTTSLST